MARYLTMLRDFFHRVVISWFSNLTASIWDSHDIEWDSTSRNWDESSDETAGHWYHNV